MERKTRKQYRGYSDESLTQALQAIKDGRMGYKAASKEFGVPKTTLVDHVKGRCSTDVKAGRKPSIPQPLERKMVETVLEASAKGFSLTKRQLLNRAGMLARNMRLDTQFRDYKPGERYWRGLKKRHPEVTIRKPEATQSSRMSMLNEVVVGRYFDDLERIVADLGLQSKPQSIWNMDETGLQFSHRPSVVVGRKGARSVLARTSDSREHVTVVASVNAAGVAMPPLCVVKGKTMQSVRSFVTEEGPRGAMWTFSERAWMTDLLGEEWFNNVFLKNCGEQRPQLLILDSHSSHETLGLLENAKRNGITLFALPPHTTSELQPLDKVLFKPLKSYFNSTCTEFMQANPKNKINKSTWPGMFRTAWEQAMTPTNIVKSFQVTGIFPVNRKALDTTALAPSKAMDRPVEIQEDYQVPHDNQPEDPYITEENAVISLEPPPSDDDVVPPRDLLAEAMDVSGIMDIMTSTSFNESIESQINELFAPTPASPKKSQSTSKAITSHRILTSPQILEQKRKQQEERDKKEETKKQRLLSKRQRKGN